MGYFPNTQVKETRALRSHAALADSPLEAMDIEETAAAAPSTPAPGPSLAEIVGAQLVLLLNHEGFGLAPALSTASDAVPTFRRDPSPNAAQRRQHKRYFHQARHQARTKGPAVVSPDSESEGLWAARPPTGPPSTHMGMRMATAPAAASRAASPAASERLPFQGPTQPGISLSEYMRRLTSYSGITAESVVIGLKLLQRLSDAIAAVRTRTVDASFARGVEEPAMLSVLGGLCRYTVHRALLVSLMMAHKVHDDKPLDNRCWAYLGGISLSEINELERLFIDLVGYQQLVVHPQDFADAEGMLSVATRRYIESRKRKLDRTSSAAGPESVLPSARPRSTASATRRSRRGRQLGDTFVVESRDSGVVEMRGSSRHSDPSLNPGAWRGPRPGDRPSTPEAACFARCGQPPAL